MPESSSFAPVPPRATGPDSRPSGGRRFGWFRRLYMTLRTEHRTPGKVAAGVAVGVLIGCSPFWGLHLAIGLVLATVFRLNRILVYAATNLANPLTAPFLIFAEIQVGHRLLHGGWLRLSVQDLAEAGAAGLFADFLLGSLLLGAVLGLLCGLIAYLITRAARLPEQYERIVDEVVLRYLAVSIRDAEAARARLIRDPIYPILLEDETFSNAPRILDLGCGRGIVAGVVESLTGAAGERRYLGVDVSERYIRAAREALGGTKGVAFVAADLRDFDPPAADVVLLLDVLRFLPHSSQDALLRRLGKAVPPGTRLWVREVDAGAGWRFRRAALADALSVLLPGRPHHRLSYRRASDLRNALATAGFSARDLATVHATPGARILLEATRKPAAATRRPSD